MIVCGNFKHLEQNLNPIDLTSKDADGGRVYQTPDGVFPSVTTVTGWSKRKFFAEWRRNNPQESKRVCSRGTSLHSVIESYLLHGYWIKKLEIKHLFQLIRLPGHSLEP